MRWVAFLIAILITSQLVLAVTISCPSTAEQNNPFQITVSHSGASKVKLYHDFWDEKTGSSHTYTIIETTTGIKTYIGDGYVGGWLGQNKLCSVDIQPEQPNTPGSVSLTATPQEIETGESISLSVVFEDNDGTDEIQIYRGSSRISTKTTCSGNSCTHSYLDTPSNAGTYGYSARGYDEFNSRSDSNIINIEVTGMTMPIISEINASPNPAQTGQTVTFSVTATDSGGDLSSIRYYFGDGTNSLKICTSGSSCSKTFTKSYSNSATYQTYARATDAAEHSTNSQTLSTVINAPSDIDGDGVIDTNDQCPNTPAGSTVVTQGQYLGCSCTQIRNLNPNPTDDGNPCTDNICLIQNGVFTSSNPPFANGEQPQGYVDSCQGNDYYNYFCWNGQVDEDIEINAPECTGCTLNHHQDCWNNHPYWYDSCNNRGEQIDTCTASEECVDTGSTASCQTVNTCNAIPGCFGSAPANSHQVSGSCSNGFTCYECNAGFEWDGSACVADCTATCSSLGFECGTQSVCGVNTNCGSCNTGQTCTNGQCTSNCPTGTVCTTTNGNPGVCNNNVCSASTITFNGPTQATDSEQVTYTASLANVPGTSHTIRLKPWDMTKTWSGSAVTFTRTVYLADSGSAVYAIGAGLTSNTINLIVNPQSCTGTPAQDTCYTGSAGACKTGVYEVICNNGNWVATGVCVNQQPSPTWYNDADDDGDGNILAPSCNQATFNNAATNSNDCDDTNPEHCTTCEEICYDSYDNDCDGQVDESSSSNQCVPLMCGGVTCQKEPLEEYYWRTKDAGGCIEEQVKKTTTYTPKPCINNACAYTTNTPTTIPTGQVRPKAIGSVCSAPQAGYCTTAGACLGACQTTTGCHATQPEGSFLQANTACPTTATGETQLCYKCPDDFVWTGDKCRDRGYDVIIEDTWTRQGESIVLSPQTQDELGVSINALYEYRSSLYNGESAQSITITNTNKVGIYPVSITAYQLVGTHREDLATKSITANVVCPDNGVCCLPGQPKLRANGETCTTNQGQGTCQNGECQLQCLPTFENNAGACTDGVDNDCDGLIDCIRTSDGKVEDDCSNFCTTYCTQGKTSCGDKCANLETSHDHCGACGNSCANNEVCEQGACVAYDDCFVACDSNSDCGNGVCREAGSCDAYCETTPILELQEEEQQILLTDVARQRTYEVQKTLEGEKLTIKITNIVTIPLENFTMTINIPKELATSASQINSDYPFEVIQEDPIIRVVLDEITTTRALTYYLPNTGDESLLNNIIISATHNNIDITQAKKLSQDDLVITRSFVETKDGTTVTLKLKPGSKLSDVRVPLEIPKCLANSVSDMTFNRDNYVVVNDDPLMVWTFDALSSEEEISFTIPNIVDEDCKNGLRAFGLAGDARKPINPWIPLAIIPLIGIILMFFQRFHDAGAQEHLSKKEFFALAREQGQSEEEIERAWHEYKRRF